MEDFKSFRIELDFADENGNRSMKMQTINVNTPVAKNKSNMRMGFHLPAIYNLSFSVKIPDFIHSYLIGKSVPTDRSNGTKDFREDFAKTIKSESIESLTERWSELISDYVWLKKMDKIELKKVIFYRFGSETFPFKSYWNGVEFGNSSKLNYKYAVGFVGNIDGKEIRYNKNKLSISTSQDKEFYSLKFVDWTESREKFFDEMNERFVTMVKKMESFEANMNPENIDEIISKQTFLLIN